MLARLFFVSIGLLLTLNARADGAQDQNFGLYAFVTSTAYNNYKGNNCSAPYCISTFPNGSIAYTSYYTVAQEVYIIGPQEGEVWNWQVIKPDNTTVTVFTINYTSGCYRWSTGYICGTQPVIFWVGPSLQCPQPTGQWTSQVLDNGVVVVSAYWNLSQGGGLIYITSPTSNQLFDLDQQNFTATSLVPYNASTTTGNMINWAPSLSYKTSGGDGSTFKSLPGFSTTSGQEQGETYQSEGGQIQATASTTAGDGSSVNDCVTFYIDGPQSGIPNTTITSQLDSLYPQSQSYPTDGTATTNLMTGVAMKESSYAQFYYPGQGVVPQPDLYPGVYGKWPQEGAGGGAYIGLMQIATTFPDAWDWTMNTSDAVNLFSGTVSPNKMQLAATYVTDIINGDPKAKPPINGYSGLGTQDGQQLENMALVLYGGWLVTSCGKTPSESCTLNSQYYIPNCSGKQGTIKKGGQTYLTCSTGWQWIPNTTNQQGGLNYVSNPNKTGVRDQLQ
jgi:hypothetical protein